jgi:hypothetical protein
MNDGRHIVRDELECVDVSDEALFVACVRLHVVTSSAFKETDAFCRASMADLVSEMRAANAFRSFETS